MQRVDLPQFEALLAEVAACYDRREYPAEAIKTWFRELEEFPFGQVSAYLRNWIRTKPKPPVISDILVPLCERRSDQIEAKAQADRKVVPLVPATEFGKQCIAEIMAKLANLRPPGSWWAYELRDRKHAGVSLGFAQEQMAKRACGSDWDTHSPYRGAGQVDRIPGSDDE